MKIGTLSFQHGIFLAPMAGVADSAFRKMCKKYGAEGVTTEMISAKALVYGDKKTALLARIDDIERPCALQLFGSDPDTMAEAAKLSLAFSPDALDINMGCPVQKVVRSGDGSALMKTPQKAYAVMCRVVEAVGDTLPVTVKIRIGFDAEHKNAVEIARLAQKAGISAVTVHGRTRAQMYAPGCDLDAIAAVKSALTIPVIGNGDIVTAFDAVNMLNKTGCDGIMVGRGALGNPHLFYEIRSFLENGTLPCAQTPAERMADMEEHMRLLIEEKGERTAAAECRKHLAWYIKGIRGAAELRDAIHHTEDVEKTLAMLREKLLSP